MNVVMVGSMGVDNYPAFGEHVLLLSNSKARACVWKIGQGINYKESEEAIFDGTIFCTVATKFSSVAADCFS